MRVEVAEPRVGQALSAQDRAMGAVEVGAKVSGSFSTVRKAGDDSG